VFSVVMKATSGLGLHRQQLAVLAGGQLLHYQALRSYAFSKVVSLEEIATGKHYSGEELREILGGELSPDTR
jgi:hypothetical protein